jgi:hypothetical protein
MFRGQIELRNILEVIQTLATLVESNLKFSFKKYQLQSYLNISLK